MERLSCRCDKSVCIDAYGGKLKFQVLPATDGPRKLGEPVLCSGVKVQDCQTNPVNNEVKL